MNKIGIWKLLFAWVLVWTPACSGNTASVTSEEHEQKETAAKEVTLTLHDGLFTDEEYLAAIEQPLKKRFPHITIIRTPQRNQLASVIEKSVAAGEQPDLYLLPIVQLTTLQSVKLEQNLSELIAKHKPDLSSVDPMLFDAVKMISGGDKGEIYAMPLYKNPILAFYNKDLFDKFGVEYPHDGMTYKDMLELSRRMTRQVDGIPYMGFYPGEFGMQAGQLSVPLVNKTGKSVVASRDDMVKVFTLQKDAYAIPGMMPIAYQESKMLFFKEKSLAVMLDWVSNFVAAASDEMNWDMVTMPVFEDKPNVHSRSDFHAGYMTNTSRHKDEAFAVLCFLASSKEIQTNISKLGRVSVHNDPSIHDQFGAGRMKGKNVSALTKTKLAPYPDMHPIASNQRIVGNKVAIALRSVLDGSKDINTALREASESIDKAVAEELNK